MLRATCSTGFVSTFAGNGTGGYSNANPVLVSLPVGVALFQNIFVVGDGGSHILRQIIFATPAPTSVPTAGPTAAPTVYPTLGVAVLGQYVASVSTFAGNGNSAVANGVGTAASFMYPWGVAYHRTKRMTYVVDNLGVNIRQIASNGQVSLLCGSPNGTYGYADGWGTNAKFYNPKTIIYANNNLFVADRANNVVRKITTSGTVTSFTVPTTLGCVDGPKGTYMIGRLYSIAFDANFNLFFTDTYCRTLRYVNITGENMYMRMIIS
jgi:hypothetical protein